MAIGLNWHKTHDVETIAAASLVSIDHRKYLTAYRELYRALENSPNSEPIMKMRQFLAQVIATALPKQSSLGQNFPNAFNPETWIPYKLAESAEVTIRIYNVKGQLIRTLDLGYKDSGYYLDKVQAAHWDGRNDRGERVSSSLYFYQIQAGSFTATRRMILVK